MKYLDKNGAIDFLLIGLLLLFFVVGGFVYWRVANVSDDEFYAEENTANQTESEPQENGFETIEGQGFTMLYPKEWPEPTIEVSPAATTIVEMKYQPDLRYSTEFEQWIVADQKYYSYAKGDFYFKVPVERKDREVIVYATGVPEKGCNNDRYTFIIGENLVNLTIPLICFNSETEYEEFEDGTRANRSIDDKTAEEEIIYSITPTN